MARLLLRTWLTLLATLDSSGSQCQSSNLHSGRSDSLVDDNVGWCMGWVHDNIDTQAGEHERRTEKVGVCILGADDDHDKVEEEECHHQDGELLVWVVVKGIC